jgi:hypothetical protein
VHREKGEEFAPEREALFAAAHADLAAGRPVETEDPR